MDFLHSTLHHYLLPNKIYVTDEMDRVCACLKSVLRLGVDKDHRTSNWVLILYQTCTTNEMSCRQELKIVYEILERPVTFIIS